MSATRLIKLHEGLELRPYRCTSGKLTIGYGRNLEARGITEAEAGELLLNDINELTAQLSSRLYWFWGLSIVRRAVLTDMAYNLGINGLLSFKKTLRHIELHDYDAAADEMLNSKWAAQVGQRADRLAEMMKTNHWPRDFC